MTRLGELKAIKQALREEQKKYRGGVLPRNIGKEMYEIDQQIKTIKGQGK